MKKILMTLVLCLAVSAQGTTTPVLAGLFHLEHVEYQKVILDGRLTFKDLFVRDVLHVNGSIKGKNLTCQSMVVQGDIDLDGCQTDRLTVNGVLKAKNLKVFGPSELSGEVHIQNGTLNDVFLTVKVAECVDSQIFGNITIKKMSSIGQHYKQSIELRGKTVVSGDISFEGEGEVLLFDSAKIEGKVINGHVKKGTMQMKK